MRKIQEDLGIKVKNYENMTNGLGRLLEGVQTIRKEMVGAQREVEKAMNREREARVDAEALVLQLVEAGKRESTLQYVLDAANVRISALKAENAPLREQNDLYRAAFEDCKTKFRAMKDGVEAVNIQAADIVAKGGSDRSLLRELVALHLQTGEKIWGASVKDVEK